MSIKERERRNQSTVWYLALPLFDKYKVKLPKRQSFTKKIKTVCENLGKTREEFGIIAKARATMYFNGVYSPVSYDAILTLARNGADIIFIEKADIVEVLSKYADKYQIALVDTQGFFTDYGKDLVKAAEDSGANITVLSDYDASGIKLAHDAGDVPRLGVDQEMLDYFGLDRESEILSIPVTAKIDVMTRIKGLVSDDAFEYLGRRKVEIDAALAVVDSERFWEYLIKKLEEHYPTRNYTRVISASPDLSDYYPASFKDIEDCIKNYSDVIVANKQEEVNTELEEFEGIIDDIEEKKSEIEEEQGAILEKDENLKELNKKFAELKPLLDNLAVLTKEKKQENEQKDMDKKG